MLWAPLLVDIHNAPAQSLFQLTEGTVQLQGQEDEPNDEEGGLDGAEQEVGVRRQRVFLVAVTFCMFSMKHAHDKALH
jgi:hypothetical protein